MSKKHYPEDFGGMKKQIDAIRQIDAESKKLGVYTMKQDAAMKLFQVAAMGGDGKAAAEQRELLHRHLDEAPDVIGGIFAIAKNVTSK